jgi:outer membrane lipoprotein carrier protein
MAGQGKESMFTRKFLSLLLLGICTVWSSPAASAAEADLTVVIAALEQGYAGLTDLQADFTQKTLIASMKREERGGGELFIRKPARGSAMFRFNYTKPRQQIISNGKTMWYWLMDTKQVMTGDVAASFSDGNGVALSYLTGMGNVSRDFTVVFVGNGRDKKGNYVIELVPKKKTQLLEKLQLTLSAESVDRFRERKSAEDPFPIRSSVVYDAFGNRTAIDYANIKTNRGMGSDRFNFKIPAGAEIIKNR